MTIKEPDFVITITKEEASMLQKACHNEYMRLKELDAGAVPDRKAQELKALRNQFCTITGSQYMGLDA